MDYITVLVGHVVIIGVIIAMAFFLGMALLSYFKEWKRHSIVRGETKKLRNIWK